MLLKTDAPRLHGIEPILLVPDVPVTLQYYQNVLGFSGAWEWGEPVTHGGLSRHGARLQFSQRDAALPGEYFIFLKNVAALHDELRGNGAEIVSPLEAKPWGIREFTVRDLCGSLLRFGEPAIEKPHKRGGLPAAFRLERNAPPLPEYSRLIRAVKWTPYTNFDAAPVALLSVQAAVTAFDGDVIIGCALLIGDRAAFFYVKDVMVDPRYQNRGVGTALMNELMKIVEEIAPTKSLVTLFTGANLDGFYQRFGFRGPEYLHGMAMRIRKPNSKSQSRRSE